MPLTDLQKELNERRTTQLLMIDCLKLNNELLAQNAAERKAALEEIAQAIMESKANDVNIFLKLDILLNHFNLKS